MAPRPDVFGCGHFGSMGWCGPCVLSGKLAKYLGIDVEMRETQKAIVYRSTDGVEPPARPAPFLPPCCEVEP